MFEALLAFCTNEIWCDKTGKLATKFCQSSAQVIEIATMEPRIRSMNKRCEATTNGIDLECGGCQVELPDVIILLPEFRPPLFFEVNACPLRSEKQMEHCSWKNSYTFLRHRSKAIENSIG